MGQGLSLVAAIVIHRLARKEAQVAEAWYRTRNPEAADRFRLAVERTADRIAAAPDSYPFLRGPYRQLRVTGFPHVLIYRMRDDQSVMVVAVAHAARRPGYWRRRQ